MLFEGSVRAGGFSNVDEAIAHGFGRFLAHASGLTIINADTPLIAENARQTKAAVYAIKEQELLDSYAVSVSGTEFKIAGISYRSPHLFPKETFYAIASSIKIAEYFGIRATNDLSRLVVPPGRSSLFRGFKNTTIVDSSYNSNVESVVAIVDMTDRLIGEKWLVLGDIIEQGIWEQEEHERLAHILAKRDFKRIILVGPRMRKHVKPILEAAGKAVESFIGPREALEYLESAVQGGEILVFKGARFLEGIIERLLEDPSDADKLCRREDVWVARRKNFGL